MPVGQTAVTSDGEPCDRNTGFDVLNFLARISCTLASLGDTVCFFGMLLYQTTGVPESFVIGRDGIIKKAFEKVKPEGHVNEVLEVLKD